jgi:regulator of protease activity HflC (stomatin/prohibitin superfamily)
VERFGRFNRVLEPGFTVLLPFVDRVRYVKTLKEVAVLVPSQSAITQDNVTIVLDGVLYYRILDPYKASYGIEDADFAITQLAQTTMRSEIGKLTLDRTLAERTELNAHIVAAINDAAAHWGIQCLRYEISKGIGVNAQSIFADEFRGYSAARVGGQVYAFASFCGSSEACADSRKRR